MANHPYHDVSVQLQILTEGKRQDVIRWLQWNDGNGIWTDDDCEAEDKPPLTLEEARSWMLVATDEERTGLPSLRNLLEETT
jgi:hypothetical protein